MQSLDAELLLGSGRSRQKRAAIRGLAHGVLVVVLVGAAVVLFVVPHFEERVGPLVGQLFREETRVPPFHQDLPSSLGEIFHPVKSEPFFF